ncbi:hypothetical protein Mpop_1870 [Methylorubrum populi BJ001]|jgi:hypothetical protein|uniref:Uncharacterized protein n=1 Tax=Methylorubrum populi (strain ATCC BAA-705 / NCIMB 13946 / BJ001) TaxID=441620 RepID=B1ZJC8_METPB|nr:MULTISPECIES: hypothetical protein [Methylorubrum]ACB80033.1 hypothetical protein Mpop_1870 [Methylorubrum populi BJ001]
MTPAAAAVVEAARRLVRQRRWYLELPADRPLPDDLDAALERALAALDATEAARA